MKKILASILTLGVVAAVAVMATNAFFTDTETSTGNVFQAGAIDLKVDNTSYYNGVASEDTSWDLRDLTIERFFNFLDLKPGDWGEDTISLHVNTNKAYVCANIQITDNEENGLTSSEVALNDDDTTGELANDLNFIFWKDDGDNVLENGEQVITQGPASNVLGGTTYALADSNGSVLEDGTEGLLPDKTYYLGKAWCFGTLATEPVAQGDNNPTQNSGITCDGVDVSNMSQTDRLMGDISFYAVQSRNNNNFACGNVDFGSGTEVKYMSLENKTDGDWQVIVDDTYGTVAYSDGASNFYGVVQGYGLEPNSKYQITLNGPGNSSCGFTDTSLGSFGSNQFESGFWPSASPNLAAICSGSDEGIYNMNLISDWYTLITDSSGNFVYPFNLDLPSGDYTGVKVLVKKMLDSHVSPWVDSAYEHVSNLFETATINFTVN